MSNKRLKQGYSMECLKYMSQVNTKMLCHLQEASEVISEMTFAMIFIAIDVYDLSTWGELSVLELVSI